MIPKIIHYCWFGGKPLPEEFTGYIEGWKKLCVDYQFMLWNENTFDVNSVPFTRQVAESKKWGFIVDYIRAWAVYHYGGIYLDTDVELLKPLDEFLDNVCFAGFESEEYVTPGTIFAGEKLCAIAKEVMDFYSSRNFINENGSLNLTPSPVIFTKILKKYSLKQNGTFQKLGVFTAYPPEYFNPINYWTHRLEITDKTHSIHHYAASWISDDDKKYADVTAWLCRVFGIRAGRNLAFVYYGLANLPKKGLRWLFGKVKRKLKRRAIS